MNKIKLFINILIVTVIITFVHTDIIKAENIGTKSEAGTITIETNELEKNTSDIAVVASETEEPTGNHTADTALYLDSNYVGEVLMDNATSEENWYYFYADANRKVTALVEQPSGGDYDIILYKLDIDSGVLTEVASSGYGGNVIDRLSAVNDSEGYYFLRVLPATASTTENDVYYFIVKIIDIYDSNEPNDNPSQSNVCTETKINLRGTIDNVFDQDWTKITVTGTKNYQVELNNVPNGAQYAVNVYDENLNVKSALISEGSNKTYVSLSAGTYYICVGSYNNQYSPSITYTFKMQEVHSLNSTFYTTNSGHQVEITNSSVYVDGVKVNLNWDFTYNINYTRIQKFNTTDLTTIDASSYQNGTFKDGQNINSSSDCIRVKINNFNMTYYCSSPYESWNKNFDENAWTYFYIDANTGKTIGTDANYYHTNMGIRNTFNRF